MATIYAFLLTFQVNNATPSLIIVYLFSDFGSRFDFYESDKTQACLAKVRLLIFH